MACGTMLHTRKGLKVQKIFRLGGVQSDWAHPQLEEGVALHRVLPNQQMIPAS